LFSGKKQGIKNRTFKQTLGRKIKIVGARGGGKPGRESGPEKGGGSGGPGGPKAYIPPSSQ